MKRGVSVRLLLMRRLCDDLSGRCAVKLLPSIGPLPKLVGYYWVFQASPFRQIAEKSDDGLRYGDAAESHNLSIRLLALPTQLGARTLSCGSRCRGRAETAQAYPFETTRANCISA